VTWGLHDECRDRSLRHVRYVLAENPVTAGAFALFGAFLFLALFGPWIAPFDPLATSPDKVLQPPSAVALVRHRPARPRHPSAG
jgi:ABC-type antimicrobial peptide transport system permease subunit